LCVSFSSIQSHASHQPSISKASYIQALYQLSSTVKVGQAISGAVIVQLH